MRLIRKQIYRAFPELDRFTDEQCVRFVGAANSSWRVRGLRWVVVAAIGIAAVIGGLVACDYTLREYDPNINKAMTPFLAAGLFAAICFVGMVLALVSRDVLLRWRVRRVIMLCGSCAKCEYSLLGMPVGADEQVTCPECGTRRRVDPSLGELAVDDRGEQVFAPEVARVDEIQQEIIRVRRAKWIKRAVLIGGGALAIGAIAYGSLWVFLVIQARAASASPSLRSGLVGAREACAPGPVGLGDDDREQEWAKLLELLGPVLAIETEVQSNGASTGTLYPQILPESLRSGTSMSKLDARFGAGAGERAKRFALEMVSRTTAATSTARLESIRVLKAPLRPLPSGEDFAGYDQASWGYGQLNAITNLDNSRMILAAGREDRREYIESMEELALIADFCDGQCTINDATIAGSIRKTVAASVTEDLGTIVDLEWLQRVRELLLRMGEGPSSAGGLETSRAWLHAHLARFFADQAKAQQAIVGVLPREYAYYIKPNGGIKPLEIGTYWSNMRAANAACDELVAQSKMESWERPITGASHTGCPLVDWSVSWTGNTIKRNDQMVREYRRAIVKLAALEFQLREGRVASGMDELAALLGGTRTGIDPFTNKPFAIRASDDGKGIDVAAPSDGGSSTQPK